jgi:hypothetical protein
MRPFWTFQLFLTAASAIVLAGTGCGRSASAVHHDGATTADALASAGGTLSGSGGSGSQGSAGTGASGATSPGGSSGTAFGGAGGSGGTAVGAAAGAGSGGAGATAVGGGTAFGGAGGTVTGGAGGAKTGGSAEADGTVTGGTPVLTGGTSTGRTATGGMAAGGAGGLAGTTGAAGGAAGCPTDCSATSCGAAMRPVCDPTTRQCGCGYDCTDNPAWCAARESCMSVCSPGGGCVCKGSCVAEGQVSIFRGCCPGLVQVFYYQDTTTCTNPEGAGFIVCTACGDQKCGLGENLCNCPEDCQ